MDDVKQAPLTLRHWTRAEYDRLDREMQEVARRAANAKESMAATLQGMKAAAEGG